MLRSTLRRVRHNQRNTNEYMSTNCRRRSRGANGARTRRGVKTTGLTLRPRCTSRASRTRGVHLPLRIARNITAGWIATWIRDYGDGGFNEWTDHFLTFDNSSLRPPTGSPLKRRRISSNSCVFLQSGRRTVWVKTRIRTQRRWTGCHQSEKCLMLQATFPEMTAGPFRWCLETMCSLLWIFFTHPQHKVSTLEINVTLVFSWKSA